MNDIIPQPESNEPSPAILEWAETMRPILMLIDMAIDTLDMDEGRRALEHFSNQASHMAAIQPILNCDPADIRKVDSEAATFRAFFKLCEMRANQRKAVIESQKTAMVRQQLRSQFGL